MIYLVENTKEGLAFANQLRNDQISRRQGALLIREDCDGKIPHLLEKILDGAKFDPSVPVNKQPWKSNSIIILVGGASRFLDEFEQVLPGFKNYFGPVENGMDTSRRVQ